MDIVKSSQSTCLYPDNRPPAHSSLTLDFEQLKPPSPHEPMPFYQAGSATTATWIKAMRDLGWNIRAILDDERSAQRSFSKMADLKIAMFSINESTVLPMLDLHQKLKMHDPSIITIAGGVGVIPQFAQVFDIAILGEGDIILPAVLRHLQGMLDRKPRSATSSAETWADLLVKMGMAVDTHPPHKWLQWLLKQGRYPALFTPEEARELTELAAERVLHQDGRDIPIPVPLGTFPDGSPRMFVRTNNRIVSTQGEGAALRLEQWKRKTGGNLNLPAFAKASSADPATSAEIDELGVRPGPDESRVYAQRGCRSTPALMRERCVYCSIKNPGNGRRASVEQVIRLMQHAVVNGSRSFSFDDDLFVQSPDWIRSLIRQIKKLGLQDHLTFSAQTRADMLPEDIARELIEAGFRLQFGLETLIPGKAARLGKDPGGNGARYVELARKTLARVAQISGPTAAEARHQLYLMMGTAGEDLRDIVAEAREMLIFVQGQWKKYGHVMGVNINTSQNPRAGDRITPLVVGQPYAQPGSIGLADPNDRVFSRVDLALRGLFIPWGIEAVGGKARATGYFMPMEFERAPAVRRFDDLVMRFANALDVSKYRFGDILYCLQRVIDEGAGLTPEEQAALGKTMREEIWPVFDELYAIPQAKRNFAAFRHEDGRDRYYRTPEGDVKTVFRYKGAGRAVLEHYLLPPDSAKDPDPPPEPLKVTPLVWSPEGGGGKTNPELSPIVQRGGLIPLTRSR